MSIKPCRNKVELNPELESLRLKGLKQDAVESNDWIFRMICRTSHIHAGFLFEDCKTLQNICLFISETQNKITDAGWEAFGYHLGLNPSVLKVINHNNFNKEDPCYNVLLAYVQHEDASIGKIIRALHFMGRIDVLSRIKDLINELADIILQCSNNNGNCNFAKETSDYESLTFCIDNNNSNSSSSSNFEPSCNVLIKPKVIPPAPFIFQNIQATPELTSQKIQQAVNNIVLNSVSISNIEEYNKQNIIEKISCLDNFIGDHRIKLTAENLQRQSLTLCDKGKLTAPLINKYGLKILLTFAADGEKYAAEISRVFRKERDGYCKIGVLILSEHANIVNKDPQQFISGAFAQVNYVCPILTSGYFDLISKKQKISTLSNIHIDALYVPYIYRLMNSYFVLNDCLNDKVRSIVPESEFSSISFRSLWMNPIFGAWVRLSEVDELVKRLLKNENKI